MSVPTAANNQPAPAFFDVPATNVPESLFRLLESCEQYGHHRERGVAALNALFPKRATLRRGLPIIPQEYIVVGEVYMDYSFLVVGQQFLLTSADGLFKLRVKVLKNRRCGRMARPIILLGTVDTSTLTGLADVTGVLQVTPDHVGNNVLGEIHPGPSNASGKGEGYPNAYGQSRPVLPDSFLPLFASFNPERSTVISPIRVPINPGAKPPVYNQTAVKVAVLDTGLYHQGAGSISQRVHCSEVHTGWNFVDNTPNVDDNHPAMHGTRIAAIIQQESPSVVCLPVKTAAANGICELYDVLCGLEYARVNGAQVVNASFSFSIADVPDEAIPLLHNMISVLENEGIWIVAAAGNASQYAPGAGGGVLLTTPLLYPACYSRADNYDRVLTVTTISKRHPTSGPPLTFGLDECYSPTYVDVGVVANSQLVTNLFANDKDFKAPGYTPAPGTSYATAYMSGLVAKAIATRYIDGKQELIDAASPQNRPELAFGIRSQEGIPV